MPEDRTPRYASLSDPVLGVEGETWHSLHHDEEAPHATSPEGEVAQKRSTNADSRSAQDRAQDPSI
jgi:hypothetical protein